MQVRSYHQAHASDRRIYRIDRWTVPVPGGLPLAASAWFLVLAIACTLLAQTPGVRIVAHAVGWPVTVLVAPGAGAMLLTRRCDDGSRPLPRLLLDRARYLHRSRAPHRIDREHCTPRRVLVAPDTSLTGRMRLTGPGRVVIDPSALVDLTRRIPRVRATSIPQRAERIALALRAGEQLEVRA